MGNKYLITYDLKNAQLMNYQGLHEAIKSSGHSWWHYLESTWIIKSNQTPTQINNLLIQHIKTGDRLLVIEIIPTGANGFLPNDAWEWLRTP